LYSDLAHWWPLFSPPAHYVEEAADIIPTLKEAPDAVPKTMLELGCGGGSLAFHLKSEFVLTLTDLSEQMLAVSRAINPECEHARGDMRTLDLGREFDLVMIHDAIMYLIDPGSLRAAFATAHRHCRRGGAVVILPDFVAETYQPGTESGGENGPDGRAMRWLQWTWDPDVHDTVFDTVYSFLLRHGDGSVTVDMDHHKCGLFPRASWLSWLQGAGFHTTSRMDPWNRDVFIAKKPVR
jgi:SAM-dependent methyltransferase